MASKFKGQLQTKIGGKGKSQSLRLKPPPDNDGFDLEDSGVHFEESLTLDRSWDADLDVDFGIIGPAGEGATEDQDSGCYGNTTMRRAETLPTHLEDSCPVSSNRKGLKISPNNGSTSSGSISRASLDSSPSELSPKSPTEKSPKSPTEKSPRSPTKERSKFDLLRRISGSDDEENSRGATKSQSVKDSRRGRLRNILRPLRRSHSAGCTKDVPAHALFLRHDFPQSRESKKGVDRGFSRKCSDSQASSDQRSPEAEADDQSDKRKLKKKKSFTKDVKEKLGFLRRRHTDTALASKLGDSSDSKSTGTMGVEKILAWRKSFDNLLQDKVGLEMFRDFLRTEFSEENIEFWIACEEYKHLKSNQLVAEAQKIYADFVAVQAEHEINLDSKTRMVTKNNLANPNKHTFEQAQKRIQALMEKDSYPRFLRSDVYQQLLRDHKVT